MNTAGKPSPPKSQSPASSRDGSDNEDFEAEDEEEVEEELRVNKRNKKKLIREDEEGGTARTKNDDKDSRKAEKSVVKKNTKKAIPDAKNKSSVRAGITGFSVGRVNRLLRSRKLASRISIKAAVYLTAVLQSLTHQLFKAIFMNKNSKKTRISSKNIYSAIKFDPEFETLVGATSVILPESGSGLPEPGSEMAKLNEEKAQKLEDEQDPKGKARRQAARDKIKDNLKRRQDIKDVLFAPGTPRKPKSPK